MISNAQNRQAERDEIERQTAAYLAKGKKIKVVPGVPELKPRGQFNVHGPYKAHESIGGNTITTTKGR